MSVPAYPEYKNSGVPWLGTVPEHWSLEPLRGQFIEHKDKNEGAQDQNYLSLVAGRGVMPYAEKGDMGNKKPDDLEKCKLVKSGNFVINSMNFGIGAFGVSAYDGVCSPVYVVLEPSQPKSLRFLRWIFDNPGFREVAQSFGNGILAHRAAIGWDELKAMWIGIPPLAEQAAIAAFLDRETAKIDALVAEQERLIALLKEKRQAVISHAVTKGLNPHAPMKDSGIEWLGEIPAHWEVVQLRRVLELQRGHDLPSDGRRSGEVPVVSSGGVIDTHDEAITSQPCIVTGRYGSIGKFNLIDVPCWPLNTALYTTRVAGVIRFQFYMLHNLAPLFEAFAAKSAVPGVDRNDLHPLHVCQPPIDEQMEISSYLDSLSKAFNKLTGEAQAAITLLQERRAALISAAVTGKIDVRGLVDAPATAELETI